VDRWPSSVHLCELPRCAVPVENLTTIKTKPNQQIKINKYIKKKEKKRKKERKRGEERKREKSVRAIKLISAKKPTNFVFPNIGLWVSISRSSVPSLGEKICKSGWLHPWGGLYNKGKENYLLNVCKLVFGEYIH
jgi:hypothetical protein